MRRDVLGGKRPDGHRLQRLRRRVRRPDPCRVRAGTPDPGLTSCCGLIPFGAFLRRVGLDRDLALRFKHLKQGRGVVYPMAAQLRLLIDANVLGELRVFGLESCAADPLFLHLAGGSVPSIDTVYRDLDRFGQDEIICLESLMAIHGLWPDQLRKLRAVHLDIDTTVEPLFGRQQGARPGPNPRYHGRPSYHPILARIAETRTWVGALLRPGDTGFGQADTHYLDFLLLRVGQLLRPRQNLRVRIDASGDCAEVMRTIDARRATFLTKARLTADLCAAVFSTRRWLTVERDALGRPLRQVAVIKFQRAEWRNAGCSVRVVALRTREQLSGKQVLLWPDLDYSVKVFLTNDWSADIDDLAREYEDRAGIEPSIGEAKHDLGIGKVPSDGFDANHVMLLVKLLTYNLVRKFVDHLVPDLRPWRLAWLRRALFCVPARLVRSGHRLAIRLHPTSYLMRLLN